MTETAELPPKPKTYNGDITGLPPALAHLRDKKVWLCWCWFWNGRKWTKPPRRTDNPERNASSNDPATWGSYEQAVEQVRAGRADGIGFALKDRDIGGVDLDHCRDPQTGQIDSWADDYMRRFPDAYIEATVSGKGLHVLGTSELQSFAPKFKLPDTGNGAAVELFSNSHHYFTLSCNEITNCNELPPIGDRMAAIAAELGGQKEIDFDAAPRAIGGAAPDNTDTTPHVDTAATNGTPWGFAEEARLRSALGAIPTDEKVLAEKFGHAHDTWVKIGRAIERLDWGDRGLLIWRDWSAQNAGEFNEEGLRTQWASFNRTRNTREKPVTIATVYLYAMKFGWSGDQPVTDEDTAAGVSLEDFFAYMPMHSYIYAPSREPWPASSVNARVPPVIVGDESVPASRWLDQNRPVEQMTWAPGLPMVVQNRLISGGGWIEREGVSCFNLYRPPAIKVGDAAAAAPWVEHAHRVFGNDAGHIIKWLAHRVQRPMEKINHAIMLGGPQGIGKDTLLEPVKYAVGPWNFAEVSPQHLLGRFNGFLRSVILRISEARDLGNVDRYSFYDHMKSYTAAPPDVLRVDEKNLREYNILNCCGVIITSNHKSDGIYLPADDRRHFVAWSDLTKGDFGPDYWIRIWSWYSGGGDRHVATYLTDLDISGFDPKAPPPKTPAFWDIVDASRAPEDAELADVLDRLGNPNATTLIRVQNVATGDFEVWIKDRKNRRQIPYRFEQCGYVSVRNDAAQSGLWVINRARQVVYAKASLSVRDRLAAARRLVGAGDDEQ
jgi:hypothetical protein